MRKNIILLLTPAFVFILVSFVGAQQAPKMRKVGFIYSTGTAQKPSLHADLFDAFRLGLRNLGYVEGSNILIERRFAEGRLDRMPALVHELIQEKVDVILAVNNVVIRAAKEATKNIPIVMLTTVDPVEAGYVASFAQPGGNITGFAWLSRDLSAKRVELMKGLLPKMSRLGVLWDSDGPGPKVAFKEYARAAEGFKLDLHSFPILGPTPDFSGSFQKAKASQLDALIVVANPLMGQHSKQVFDLAVKNHFPSMSEERRYIEAGGLISYGANLADLYRRAAEYVVDIIKGAKPEHLPVKLPGKFEIFINLKTAQSLGLTIPKQILLQADKVIQ